MHMLRHQDVGPQIERPFPTGRLQLFKEPDSRPVTIEELVAVVAGERQLPRLAGLVETPTDFPKEDISRP